MSNTFRNEYPQYEDASFEVYHHSEYLAMLAESGRLSAERPTGRKVVFHDPCYLGRHNGVFDPPRRLIKLSVKSPAAELKQSRGDSFCCGGGGGMSFVEEAKDQRVNQERARQLLETGADTVAVETPARRATSIIVGAACLTALVIASCTMRRTLSS